MLVRVINRALLAVMCDLWPGIHSDVEKPSSRLVGHTSNLLDQFPEEGKRRRIKVKQTLRIMTEQTHGSC